MCIGEIRDLLNRGVSWQTLVKALCEITDLTLFDVAYQYVCDHASDFYQDKHRIACMYCPEFERFDIPLSWSISDSEKDIMLQWTFTQKYRKICELARHISIKDLCELSGWRNDMLMSHKEYVFLVISCSSLCNSFSLMLEGCEEYDIFTPGDLGFYGWGDFFTYPLPLFPRIKEVTIDAQCLPWWLSSVDPAGHQDLFDRLGDIIDEYAMKYVEAWYQFVDFFPELKKFTIRCIAMPQDGCLHIPRLVSLVQKVWMYNSTHQNFAGSEQLRHITHLRNMALIIQYASLVHSKLFT